MQDRKEQILDAGAKLAEKYGAINVTRRMVAQVCKVSEPLISRYVGKSKAAQALYARRAAKLGLKQPDKAKQIEIGIKLRKHQAK